MKVRKLDPVEAARIKRMERCPDCRGSVKVTPTGDQVEIKRRHDGSCPAFRGGPGEYEIKVIGWPVAYTVEIKGS
ncbi:hypothetical protein ACIODS_04245 [Micromonospora chalcea]|uniref:hypothetical protein n=1 Tax=Micromonospora chalcea TaxID=1874 RepID=UPI00381502DA